MPFNIGLPELLIIMVIALIVFGPRKLPEIGGQVGKAMREFRRASSELTEEWTREVEVKKEEKREKAPEPQATTITSHAPEHTQAYKPEPSGTLIGPPEDSQKPLAEARPKED